MSIKAVKKTLKNDGKQSAEKPDRKGLRKKVSAKNLTPAQLNLEALGAMELEAAVTSDAPVAPQKSAEPWIEIFPYGITVGGIESRPVLVLKDQSQSEVLPVWLHPMDAGLALSDLSQQPASPHKVTRKILEDLGLKVERCEFVEAKGHHQYVEIYFKGHDRLKSVRLRADEAMSFCLAMHARFFSTRSFMLRCRDMDAELARVEQGLLTKPERMGKNHPYIQ